MRLIDEREPGMGASFGNAGLISVDSCVPIALPGMLRQVPKWLLDSTGPLTVKPSYLPKASKWLWQWVRSGATLAKVSQQSQALRRLHKPAFVLYKDLLGNDFHRSDDRQWANTRLGAVRPRFGTNGSRAIACREWYISTPTECRRDSGFSSDHFPNHQARRILRKQRLCRQSAQSGPSVISALYRRRRQIFTRQYYRPDT